MDFSNRINTLSFNKIQFFIFFILFLSSTQTGVNSDQVLQLKSLKNRVNVE